MDFDSHSSIVVGSALALANEVTSGHRRGKPYDAPAGKGLTTALTSMFHALNSTWGPPPSDEAATSLAEWGVRLHGVIAAVDRGDVDSACEEINRITAETGATPVLSRHDGQAWHLHFHALDASWEVSWAASMATGLAIVLGNPAIDRLGICTAPACDRAYLDTSRNGTRRFCSTACQNRVKTAAFRARKTS
ncbi:CGNR zinc finger domain-containing protein [Actinokineospora sp. HUAS TT18]|uniref:CGNR zinc finger domain-containing protein n=1 Tax=Actinokineospora sp. HUAS TT18 TaxID=3447451 RepID=UPI003F523572